MWAIRGRWIGVVAAIVLMDQLLVSARSQGFIVDRRPVSPDRPIL